jgi:hypothetical protein
VIRRAVLRVVKPAPCPMGRAARSHTPDDGQAAEMSLPQ